MAQGSNNLFPLLAVDLQSGHTPTPDAVVNEMLKLGRVGHDDIVYDLGCGDGRIVIAAALMGASWAIGVDDDAECIVRARTLAHQAGVTHKVRFIKGDLFEIDFSQATVVTLYLMPSVMLKLKPSLLAQLKPGARIVAHSHNMGQWEPDETKYLDRRSLYLWIVRDPLHTHAVSKSDIARPSRLA